MTNEATHYETLGVSIDADQSEIKKAYRELVLAEHPDKVQQNFKHDAPDATAEVKAANALAKIEAITAANEKLKRINGAYSILKNNEKRAEYDRTLPNNPPSNVKQSDTSTNTQSNAKQANFSSTGNNNTSFKPGNKRTNSFTQNNSGSRHDERSRQEYYEQADKKRRKEEAERAYKAFNTANANQSNFSSTQNNNTSFKPENKRSSSFTQTNSGSRTNERSRQQDYEQANKKRRNEEAEKAKQAEKVFKAFDTTHANNKRCAPETPETYKSSKTSAQKNTNPAPDYKTNYIFINKKTPLPQTITTLPTKFYFSNRPLISLYKRFENYFKQSPPDANVKLDHNKSNGPYISVKSDNPVVLEDMVHALQNQAVMLLLIAVLTSGMNNQNNDSQANHPISPGFRH